VLVECSMMYFTPLFLLLGLFSPIIETNAGCNTASVLQSLGLSLGSWSSTYGSDLTNNIVVTQPLLVDVESISAQGITLGNGGILYFDWDISIELTADYILVSSGGELHIGTENCPITEEVTITLAGTSAYVDPNFGSNFIGIASGGTLELHGAKALGNSWTKISETAEAGATEIQVLGNTAGWEVGDVIVIATTDFSPLQSETVTITQISGSTISFTPALTYMHYGEITYEVDERAEVGLLTRNILIQGAPGTQYFGGHLMIMRGFKAVHAEGIQLYNMGQDQIARYPFHFHLCNDVPEGTYVRYNSVYQSNFRCFTIHTTNGVLLEGNVAYDHYGHCYFLEDGIEQNNTFIGNLAILTRPKDFGQRIGSDMTGTGLSSYWISNVQNTFVDNAAAGSYTNGFWIITRLGARGLSACLPEYQNLPYVPANQLLISFVGNSAHSCSFGLGIESTDWDAGDNPAQLCDTPVANWQPTLPNGTIVNSYFQNFTSHHVETRAVWARLPNIVLIGARLADNYESVEYATSGDMPPYPSQQFVQDTIIVGFSGNVGNNAPDEWQTWDTVCDCSRPFDDQTPINGMKLYDGAQALVDVTFVNFPQSTRLDAPLGGRLADQSQVATTNLVRGLQFQNVAYRYLVLDNDMDGGLTTNFRDTDGSVSSYSGSTVMRNFDYYVTPNCVASSLFMLVCPHRYVQLWVLDMTNSGTGNNMIITRSDHVGTNHTAYSLTFTGFNTASVWRYQPIVSIGSNYLIYFQNHVPSSLALQLNNAELNDAVGVAICYPPGTIIQSVYRGYSNYVGSPYPTLSGYLTYATSIPSGVSISASNVQDGGSYYYDSVHSILYVSVSQRYNRTNYANFCPGDGCDFVWVTASFSGSAVAPDCTQQAYSSGFQVTSSSWLDQTLTPAGNTPTPTPIPATPAPSTSARASSSTSTSTSTSTSAKSTTSTLSTASSTSSSTASTSTGSTSTSSSCTCGNLDCCGPACYDPTVYQCNAGNALCPLGMESCGNYCYLTSQYQCQGSSLEPW